MTRKKLTILISVLSSVLLAGIITAICLVCTRSFKKTPPAAPSYSIIDIDTGYEWFYQPQNRDEHDADTDIDGVLDDERWQGDKKWLTHKEKNVEMRYTTSFSEKGLYIAAEAVDSHMVYNDVRAFLQNSSFCFYIVSNQATQYNVFDCFEFYVDEKNAACRQQTHFTAKAVKSANDASVPKLTAEFFASWDALHYTVDEDTKMPASVRIAPMYRYVESMGSVDNAYLKPVFTEWGNQLLDNTLRFDGDGYINIDAEGAEIGNAANGFAKSDGWDLSNVKGENGVKSVKTNQPASQAIFFSNISSSRYSYTVKMKMNGGINDDNPSCGILDMKSAREFNIMRIRYNDYKDNGKKRLNCFFLDFYTTVWHDALEGAFDFAESFDEVDIRVIKDDTRYYYILNGKYCMGKDIDWLGGKTTPGFASLGADVEYSDWEVTDYEGEDKDDEFKALCAQYINIVSVPERVSGGTLTVDKVAIEKGKTESVQLYIQPSVGYILTDLTINGESVYDELVPQMVNGVLYIDVNKDTAIDATFTALPATSTLRIAGLVKRSNGNTIVGMPYTVQSTDDTLKNVLFTSGNTTASGMFDIRLLKAGTYTIGGKEITADGKYRLVFHGVFPQDEVNVIDIDTNSSELASVSYFEWDDVELNPYRVSNMVDKGEYIQTTVTNYAGAISSYYVKNDLVTGGFRLDLSVNAANDAWPCYGITIEDESNNSVQFFAGGSDVYRLTRNYSSDFVTQSSKGVAYRDKISNQCLIYDAEEDAFYFYVNGMLFDTVKRNRYLVGTSFKYGVCGYMVGADGSVEPITDDKPLAKFVLSKAKQNLTATLPSGASITVNGEAVSADKVPVCATATVGIPVEGDGMYNFYIDGNVLDTVVSDGVAKATFKAYDDFEITFERTYAVDGTAETEIDGNTVEGATVNAVNSQGSAVYSAKADAQGKYTLRLPNGTYYITAQTQSLVSSASTVIVNNGDVSGSTTISIDKFKLIPSEYSEIPYDAVTGKYAMKNGIETNAGYFSGVTLTRNQPFVLHATVEKFSGDNYPSSGFIVRIGSKNYRFTVRNINGYYDTVAWHNDDVDQFGKMSGALGDDPFTQDGETMNIALAFNNGIYHMFVNNTAVFSVTEVDTANSVRLGLFCERDITFADWGYSVDAAEVRRYLGVTLSLEDGVSATVGGTAVVDNKATIGDEITVTKAVADGERISFVLDGTTLLDTTIAEGKATATFKATRNTHSLTTRKTYEVSGTAVAGATVVIVYENGDAATTVTANADGNWTAYLGGDTKYYIHAYSADRISKPKSVSVAQTAVSGVSLTVDKYLLAQSITGFDKLYFNAVTGTYKSENDEKWSNAMTIAGVSHNSNGDFVLTASVNKFDTQWASAGFIVGIDDSTYRFVLRYNGSDYDAVAWHNKDVPNAGEIKGIADAEMRANPFTNAGDTAQLALVYSKGMYRFYVNGENVHCVSEIDGGEFKLGLFCEREAEYTDWGYATDISSYHLYALSGTVASGTTSVMITDPDGESSIKVDVGSGRYTAVMPNGTYLVYAENETKVSSAVSATVNNAAATANLTAPVKDKLIPIDGKRSLFLTENGYKSGADKQGDDYNAQNGGYFAGANAATNSAYALTATVKKFNTTTWSSAGFTVGFEDKAYTFILRYNDAHEYDIVAWHNAPNADVVAITDASMRADPFTNAGNTAQLALVYKDGKYRLFVNGKLVHTVAADDAATDVSVGLFCEREVTFADWGYSADAGRYIQTVSGTTGANAEITVYSSDEKVVSTTTADSSGAFTAVALVGTNYIVAETATHIGSVSVNVVSGTPYTGATVNAGKIKLLDAGAHQLAFDYRTQNYVTTGNVEDDAYKVHNGFFAGGTVTDGKPFVMTATVNKFQNVYDSNNRWLWHSAGFLVAIGDARYSFTFRASGNATDPQFDTVIWGMENSPIVSSLIDNPFTNADTVDIAVVYNDGTYYLFYGDTLINTVVNSHGTTAVTLGLSTEHKISYAAWNYSEARADLERYLGRTVDTSAITGKTVTVKAGDRTVAAGGKVLVGETVTVAIAETTNGAIMLNDNKLTSSVVNGALTVTFVITTDKNYVVTFNDTVKVGGSITGGNAQTIFTIVNASGAESATGNCKADGTFEAELPAGEYYLSAESADKVSGVSRFEVGSSEVTGLSVSLTDYKLVATDDKPLLIYDRKTGNYIDDPDPTQRYGLFAGQSIASGTPFVVTARVNRYEGLWDCAGLTVKTSDMLYAFSMRHRQDQDGSHRYDGVVWAKGGEPSQPAFGDELNNALHGVAADGKFELALVYRDGTFYMFVNSACAYAFRATVNSAVQIGLFSEREHVFDQWGYSLDIDAYLHNVSGTTENGNTVKVMDITTNAIYELTATDGAYNISLPNGTYYAYAENTDKISGSATQITVAGAEVTDINVTADSAKSESVTIGGNNSDFVYDIRTASYKGYDNADSVGIMHFAWLKGDAVNKEADFYVEATISDTAGAWFGTGFIIGSAENYLRFDIVRKGDTESNYGFRVLDNAGRQWLQWDFDNTAIAKPYGDNQKTPLKLAIVRSGNNYYVLFNDDKKLNLTANTVFGDTTLGAALTQDTMRVGLFAERQATFSDWSYGTDISRFAIA